VLPSSAVTNPNDLWTDLHIAYVTKSVTFELHAIWAIVERHFRVSNAKYKANFKLGR